MNSLADVDRVHVPRERAVEAQTHLRRVGEHASEGFALWAGTLEGTAFHVRETVIPAQRELRTGGGVAVVVDGDELHRLNLWLYEHRMTLIAQLHSHPGAAYHSPTDDALPIATAVGSLSLVVPDFARAPFALDRCAVYRLAGDGAWVELAPAQARELIVIEA
ncbi:MAG: hypothetical protein M3Q71_08250 [Chloroflexota bacterium]|nr:hypothetical protein [Chloroflexota bacterium]